MLRAQGTLFTIAFAIAAVWLTVNLRIAARDDSATCGRSSRPVKASRCRCLAGASCARSPRTRCHRRVHGCALCLVAVGDLAHVAQRGTLRTDRSDSRTRRRFLRLLASLLPVGARPRAGTRAPRRYRCRRDRTFVSGSLTSRFGAMPWMTPTARRHLSLLAALFLVLLAFGAWLSQAERLVQPSGVIYGPGYADVNGRMPAALILAVVCVIGAVLAALQAFTPRNWPIPVAVVLYLVAAVGGEVYSTLLQRFVVTPNEQTRESPFIQHNIDATRRAFGLDRVEAAGADRRRAAHTGRRRAQRGDDRERPAVGPPAAARHLRPAAGHPHLLRLRVGGQRPVPHRRCAAADHAVAARAEHGEPAEPHVDQRPADVHARLRPDAWSREPGHERRAAGALRREPAARDDAGAADRGTEPVFRRAVERLRDRADGHARISLPARRRATSSRSTTAAAACRSARSGGS